MTRLWNQTAWVGILIPPFAVCPYHLLYASLSSSLKQGIGCIAKKSLKGSLFKKKNNRGGYTNVFGCNIHLDSFCIGAVLIGFECLWGKTHLSLPQTHQPYVIVVTQTHQVLLNTYAFAYLVPFLWHVLTISFLFAWRPIPLPSLNSWMVSLGRFFWLLKTELGDHLFVLS